MPTIIEGDYYVIDEPDDTDGLGPCDEEDDDGNESDEEDEGGDGDDEYATW